MSEILPTPQVHDIVHSKSFVDKSSASAFVRSLKLECGTNEVILSKIIGPIIVDNFDEPSWLVEVYSVRLFPSEVLDYISRE